MRRSFALMLVLPTVITLAASPAAAREFFGRDDVNAWMDGYRHRPEPRRLPAAVKALSQSMTFKDPETAGFYVGFISGVIRAELPSADPKRIDALLARMPPLPPQDQWVLVRAIAYSGVPHWRQVLRQAAPKVPARREMIAAYLAGRLPTLDAIALDQSPTWLEKLRMSLSNRTAAPVSTFANSPELLDTLWGQYFATGSEAPVRRILTMLPWAKDRDSIERLTVGSLAKVTLANHASRNPDLMAMLKDIQRRQPPESAKLMAEVIAAADTVEGPRLRREALAALDDLKRKGPGSRREIAFWGQIGQGALALGCIAAAAASLTALGLPCVVGGAVASAGLYYYTAQ